jgi:hypothetical protein
MEESSMKDPLNEIELYVSSELKTMTKSQIQTLRTLLLSGYKGERETLLVALLKTMDEDKITTSTLIESFTLLKTKRQ